jgi:hypothetical protein
MFFIHPNFSRMQQRVEHGCLPIVRCHSRVFGVVFPPGPAQLQSLTCRASLLAFCQSPCLDLVEKLDLRAPGGQFCVLSFASIHTHTCTHAPHTHSNTLTLTLACIVHTHDHTAPPHTTPHRKPRTTNHSPPHTNTHNTHSLTHSLTHSHSVIHTLPHTRSHTHHSRLLG